MVAPGDLIVVNNTRVRAARIHGTRVETGGRVELLLLERETDRDWVALAKPSRRLRPGVRIVFDDIMAEVTSDPIAGKVSVRFETPNLEVLLPGLGEMPLPPYFSGKLSDPDRYQTMFAEIPGSAAAPTAGLHFTSTVKDRLGDVGIGIAEVDLHVSLDTFRPMTTDEVEHHQMHSEWCSVSAETAARIEALRQRGGRLVAVGTTVVRTLESRSLGDGLVEPGSGQTDLFLRPGSRIEVVDDLITNFHLPGSTLLVLMAAFMGEAWRHAYETAVERRYRFLSFGDAMLAAKAD